MDDYVVFLQEHEVDIGVVEDDPINFRQAIESSNSQKWIDAMNEEMTSMKDNDVWTLYHRLKVRNPLVVNGIKQRRIQRQCTKVQGSSCSKGLYTLVAHFNLKLHQMDVKTAFLNGDIDEIIYMVQPENFVSGDAKKMVSKLKKSIYGLKQASRQWYYKFHQVVISFGFEMNLADDCIYHKFSGIKYIILVLYVDDILLATNDIGLLHETKRFLSKQFEMKDFGDASFVLGIQIYRDRSRGILKLSQKIYIDNVLKRFGM